MHDQHAEPLVCAECGKTANANADGWRAYFTDDKPKEIRPFCPDCAEREFGERFRWVD